MVTPKTPPPAAMKAGGCFAWLALYAALTWALAVVLMRRVEVPQLAIGSSAVIALMACVALDHLIRVLRVALDLVLRVTRNERGLFFDGTKPHAFSSAAPPADDPILTKLGRAGSGLINGAVFAAIAGGIGALLLAFAPLETETPWWEEIRLENLLEQKVRPRIMQAEILPIPPPARTLQEGEARGRFRVEGREWVVDRASRATSESGEEIALLSGNDPVAVIHIDARGLVSMTTAAGPFSAPDVIVDIRQTDDGWIGRITWSEGQLVFRV
jgi:hypothetical protein